MESNKYLLWSCEHHAWWRAEGVGFSKNVAEAGRYDRVIALDTCFNAIPLNADRLGYWPLLPVMARDAEMLTQSLEMMPFNFYKSFGRTDAAAKGEG